jgi:hypothetical protein
MVPAGYGGLPVACVRLDQEWQAGIPDPKSVSIRRVQQLLKLGEVLMGIGLGDGLPSPGQNVRTLAEVAGGRYGANQFQELQLVQAKPDRLADGDPGALFRVGFIPTQFREQALALFDF